MPCRCCAKLCKNVYKSKYESSVSFFRFRRTKEEYDAWAKICGDNMRKSLFLCSEHFRPEDIQISKGVRHLKKGALPIDFLKLKVHTTTYGCTNSSCSRPRCGIKNYLQPRKPLTTTKIAPYISLTEDCCEINKCPSKVTFKITEAQLPQAELNEKEKNIKSNENIITKNNGSIIIKNPDITCAMSNINTDYEGKSICHIAIEEFPEDIVTIQANPGHVLDIPPIVIKKKGISFSNLSGFRLVPFSNDGASSVPPPTSSMIASTAFSDFHPEVVKRLESPNGVTGHHKKTNSCSSNSSICSHYVSFIEERAKNHKLTRELEYQIQRSENLLSANEEMIQENKKLMEKLKILEALKVEQLGTCDVYPKVMEYEALVSDIKEENETEVIKEESFLL